MSWRLPGQRLRSLGLDLRQPCRLLNCKWSVSNKVGCRAEPWKCWHAMLTGIVDRAQCVEGVGRRISNVISDEPTAAIIAGCEAGGRPAARNGSTVYRTATPKGPLPPADLG